MLDEIKRDATNVLLHRATLDNRLRSAFNAVNGTEGTSSQVVNAVLVIQI